jgi:hypothetical protein
MSKQRFEPGEVYEAYSGKRVVGTFTGAFAEQLAQNPIYAGLRFRKIKSKPVALPTSVAKKDKAATKNAVTEDEQRNIEPIPADREDQ